MTTMSSEKTCFNPLLDDLRGKKMGAWCLCPAWMGWMPWLVDGVEVVREQGMRREGNSVSHHHQAGLNG